MAGSSVKKKADLYSSDQEDVTASPAALQEEPFDTFSTATASHRLAGGGPLYADAARRAGRLNAAAISPEEHQSFLLERKRLLEKKYASGLTRRESNRLDYVRWSLDRIEDAKKGFSLDALEASVSMYEGIAKEIESLRAEIRRLSDGKGTRKSR